MKGAVDYVKKHRNVALVDLPYRVDAPNSIRLDRPLPFDAAFIWATPEARWVEDLLAASLPLVGASGDWPSEQVPYISFDGKAVEERAIEHLARRKPEILLHLEFLITGVPLIENRTRRFCDLARRRGFPVKSFELFRLGDPEDNSLTRRMPLQGKAAKRLKSLLRGLSRPAAIWCGDDWLGLRVCEAAVALGLRIPEDVAVLGLGDFAGAEGGHPSLSSIPLPGETIAYHALTILNQRLSGKNDFPDRLLVSPPPVVARESTIGVLPQDSVGKALQIIAERACEGITVRKVAAAVGLSPQTLTAQFMERNGRPPGEEIRRARLAKAKRHLHDSRLSISEVASLCGYAQQSKFSNFFKRETGLSPRDYRKEHY